MATPKLSVNDAQDLQRLPLTIALDRIKQRHRSEPCGNCGKLIGNHGSKAMKHCFQQSKGATPNV